MNDKVSSGYSGPDVKSDCEVGYTAGDSALKVEIETEHGTDNALENAVLATADRLGVARGKVEVTDRGAEPFVVAARFEAAARRVVGSFPPPPRLEECLVEESDPHRPRRSRLYVPGNRPRFFRKALDAGADAVILDLEDSVSPSRKEEARVLVCHALRALDFGNTEIMVRINQGAMGLVDLEWIVPQPVQHILVPKVETAARVAEVQRTCADVMDRSGRRERIWLMPIVESPLGVLNAPEIARAAEEMCALTLGLQDLTAELGVRPTSEGMETFTARSMIVLAARAAGLQPIDTVYPDVKNEEGLKRSVERARELGFVGKGCIHPRQVPTVNQGFLPGDEELERAKKIVLAMEDARSRGLGAVALGSKMIDPPVARRAENLVRNAIRLGLLAESWQQDED
ncbi:citrate lyase ACP [Candidatus Fermentibacteria bacterium]|nr:citrate lyase ACP [Candidatus Fermentibacteria bacterium]